MTERVQPFSNGGEYRNWVGLNCKGCNKSWFNDERNRSSCNIERALDDADSFDGTIRKEYYDRMGDGSGQCPELEGITE